MDTTDDLAMPFLLLGAFRNLVDAVHARLADEGFPQVRATHGFALQAIGEGCTSVQLGERLGVSKQAAAKTAATLESMGLITRRANHLDRRERVLTIEPRGQELLRVSAIAFRAELRQWRERAGADQVDITAATLALVGAGGRRATDLSDWV